MKPKTFDLNLLQVVVALDTTRSVTGAAQELGMSQPGLSTALARLRKHFGDPMFVRTSEGMRPTPRGMAVADEARAVLLRVNEKVLNSPRFVPEEATTEFRFAMPDVAEMTFMPRLIEAFRTAAPNAHHNASRITNFDPKSTSHAKKNRRKVFIPLGDFALK